MLELKKIYKRYDREVLNNISIKFPNKGLICLVGESGSGKTTLLNIIGGLDTPDGGKVLLDNINIVNIDGSYYRNQLVSFINQNYNLIDKYTVLENILLPSEVRKKNKIFNINKVLKMLKIEHLKNNKVIYLSGGEKQRVTIARCLIQNTKIILADEPTGALDTDNAFKVMKILKNLSRNRLIIVVTHNIELANTFADNIIKIQDGKIISNNKINDCKFKIYPKIRYDNKVRLKFISKIKYAFKNINNKLLRNILTVVAFTIGLFSLGIVLSIKDGFNKELDKLSVTSLFSYPIVISKNGYVDDFNNKYENRNGVNVKKGSFINNNIDDKLINLVNSIDKRYIKGISYYRDIDSLFRSISYINPCNDYFYLINGRMPENDNEVLVLYDEDNSISDRLYNYLDVENNGLINNIFMVGDKELIITGVVRSSNDYFKGLNGILYSNSLFDSEITDVYIYASDLDAKNYIKDYLKDYNILDNAEDALDVSRKLVDGISVVLIVFSIISLIVSVIMIFVMSYISILESYKDIGIFKSIGFRNIDIRDIFVLENILIGVCSFYLSNILVLIIGGLLNKYVNSYVNIEHIVNFNMGNILCIFMVSMFICYFASIVPAVIGSKKRVIDIMNN